MSGSHQFGDTVRRFLEVLGSLAPASPPLTPEEALYQARWAEIEATLDKDNYSVREARGVLAEKGLDVHIETLRRKIRAGEIEVSKPSPRKTLIPKRAIVRLLVERQQ